MKTFKMEKAEGMCCVVCRLCAVQNQRRRPSLVRGKGHARTAETNRALPLPGESPVASSSTKASLSISTCELT